MSVGLSSSTLLFASRREGRARLPPSREPSVNTTSTTSRQEPRPPRLAGLPADHAARNLPQVIIAAFDAVEVVLDDAVTALAEVLAQGLLDAGVNLVVIHLGVLGVGRELEERAQEDDALHAHLQVSLGGHLAGNVHHVAVEDADLLF